MACIGDEEETPSFASWDRIEQISFTEIIPWLWDEQEGSDAPERIAFLPCGRKPGLRFDVLSLLDGQSTTSDLWIIYLSAGLWWDNPQWVESVVFVVRSEEEKADVEAQLATVQNSGWREKSSVVLEER